MDLTIQYIPIMIVGFATSLGLTPLSRQIAMRLGLIDKPGERKIHLDHKPLMGGLAIYTAFALSLLLFSPSQHVIEFGAIVAGAGLMALVGLLDDRYQLTAITRLIAMALASVALILVDVHIRLFNNFLIDYALTIIWVLAIVNATNFLDNMDGLAAGIAAISAGFFLLIAVTQGQVLVSMLASALFGSAIGFLVYNFNPASTFMGDMGALTLGFILAVLGIKLNFGSQPLSVTWMVPVFVLAVPIFDINLVVFTRLLEKRSPAQAGKDHTSHRLMSLGFNQRYSLALLYGANVFFGLLAFTMTQLPPELALALGIAGLVLLLSLFAMMIWIRERYQKNHEPDR